VWKGRGRRGGEGSPAAGPARGRVTLSQPGCGTLFSPAKSSGVHAAGERPEAFRPRSSLPSQTIAKRSEPIPFEIGSTTVSVIAVASAASIAFPPSASTRAPACAASGWEGEATFAAIVGRRAVRDEEVQSGNLIAQGSFTS